MRYDLHTHSRTSDGVLSPSDLVNHARAQGVDVLALTDHDATAGIAEAAAAAQGLGIRLIPGVEISVTWNTHLLHILGLAIRPDHVPLQQGLSRLREFRIERARKMAERLQRHGIPGVYEGAQRYAAGPVFGRMHIARYLVEGGYADDLNDAFKRYLKPGKPGYEKGVWAGLEEALSWITAAGGFAVLAHPFRYDFTATRLRTFLDEFKVCGGAGIEVVSGKTNQDEITTLAHYAQRYQLAASQGSDYHGPGAHTCELGGMPALPDNVTPIWELWG